MQRSPCGTGPSSTPTWSTSGTKLDAVRDFGSMVAEPGWARQTVTSKGHKETCEVKEHQALDPDGSQSPDEPESRGTASDGTDSSDDRSREPADSSRRAAALSRDDTGGRRRCVAIPTRQQDRAEPQRHERHAGEVDVTFDRASYRVEGSHTITRRSPSATMARTRRRRTSRPDKDKDRHGKRNLRLERHGQLGSYTITVNNPNRTTPPNSNAFLTFTSENAAKRRRFGAGTASPGPTRQEAGTRSSFCMTDNILNNAGYRPAGGMVPWLTTCCGPTRPTPSARTCWRTPHYPAPLPGQAGLSSWRRSSRTSASGTSSAWCYADSAVDEATNFDGLA